MLIIDRERDGTGEKQSTCNLPDKTLKQEAQRKRDSVNTGCFEQKAAECIIPEQKNIQA